ncbi:AAA family ATPase [Candidatus Pacearchaeota archaeon]|nr:AAA family ATPase [Candidatus Pacearchaeota archaeon]
MDKIDKIFDSINSRTLFKNKTVLQSNYSPLEIPYRDKQIETVASILAPALIGQKTSNLFIYGKTGTGKTLTVQYVRNELSKRAKEQYPLRIEYVNCKLKKVADTEYRMLAELIKQLGGDVPATGLPTDQVYNKFLNLLQNSKEKLFILILDEIDQLVKKISDNFLYNLTRLNSELTKTQIIIVGISNDLRFLESLDPRVRSSLSEEEIVFPPYNALQLQGILNKRALEAFKENIIDPAALSKCAAFAAREHGDARRALDLLRVAGEIAERNGDNKITIKHIDEANNKIERDKILDIVETEPKQFQAVLQAIIHLEEGREYSRKQKQLFDDETGKIFTGDVYNVYQDLCKRINMEVLTQRRVGDILSEFDMLGIINAKVISKGRYGRTKEIKLAIPQGIIEKIKEILRDSLGI